MENVLVFAAVIYIAILAGVEFINFFLRSTDKVERVLKGGFIAFWITMTSTLIQFEVTFLSIIAVIAVSFAVDRMIEPKATNVSEEEK